MESLQENKATGQVYLYQTAQGYFQKLYICAKLWRPMDCLFHTNNPTFTPPPQPFSSLYYQPNTLIPPHCNTIKATQHLKIMIWVWCRTLNTYSCMRQKKKHLLIIVMMKTVFVSRDERCADMIYKKKDNFVFWRNLWYHTIELKDIFIHKI